MDPSYLKRTKEKFPTLTKGLKKVADHLLSEPMTFAIHPAKKVGEIIGVSETMVIRFCNTIGYNGFAALQKEVRQQLLYLKESADDELNTEIYQANNFVKSMRNDAKNLEKNIDGLELDKMETTVETIINSEKIIVAGYYHSFTFAHWFYFNLNYALGNASLYRPENDAGLLDLLPSKSCIVIFSFYRYALDTIRLAEEANHKGIKVICITDSRVSPVAEYADIVIPINISQKTLFNKGPVTMSLINSILFEIMLRVEEHGKIKSTYKYFIKDGELE